MLQWIEKFFKCVKEKLHFLFFPETQIRGNRSGKIDFPFSFPERILFSAKLYTNYKMYRWNRAVRFRKFKLRFYNYLNERDYFKNLL